MPPAGTLHLSVPAHALKRAAVSTNTNAACHLFVPSPPNISAEPQREHSAYDVRADGSSAWLGGRRYFKLGQARLRPDAGILLHMAPMAAPPMPPCTISRSGSTMVLVKFAMFVVP